VGHRGDAGRSGFAIREAEGPRQKLKLHKKVEFGARGRRPEGVWLARPGRGSRPGKTPGPRSRDMLDTAGARDGRTARVIFADHVACSKRRSSVSAARGPRGNAVAGQGRTCTSFAVRSLVAERATSAPSRNPRLFPGRLAGRLERAETAGGRSRAGPDVRAGSRHGLPGGLDQDPCRRGCGVRRLQADVSSSSRPTAAFPLCAELRPRRPACLRVSRVAFALMQGARARLRGGTEVDLDRLELGVTWGLPGGRAGGLPPRRSRSLRPGRPVSHVDGRSSLGRFPDRAEKRALHARGGPTSHRGPLFPETGRDEYGEDDSLEGSSSATRSPDAEGFGAGAAPTLRERSYPPLVARISSTGLGTSSMAAHRRDFRPPPEPTPTRREPCGGRRKRGPDLPARPSSGWPALAPPVPVRADNREGLPALACRSSAAPATDAARVLAAGAGPRHPSFEGTAR